MFLNQKCFAQWQLIKRPIGLCETCRKYTKNMHWPRGGGGLGDLEGVGLGGVDPTFGDSTVQKWL